MNDHWECLSAAAEFRQEIKDLQRELRLRDEWLKGVGLYAEFEEWAAGRDVRRRVNAKLEKLGMYP